MSSYRKTAPLALLAALCAAPAGAAEYTATAIVDQRLVHDDNLLLAPDECRRAGADTGDPCMGFPAPEENYGYELAPQFRLRARSSRWEADGGVLLRYSRFDDGNLDSDDQLLDASISRLGERSRWDLEGSFERVNTRTRIFELDEFVRATERVESWQASPSWTRLLTERDSLVVSGSTGKTNYAPPRLSDYDFYDASVGWLRQLGEKTRLQVSVYQSNFRTGLEPRHDRDLVNQEVDADTTGLQLSYTRQFNERLDGSFAIGARRTDTSTTFVEPTLPCLLLGLCEITTASNETDGFTASAGLEYRGEAWQLGATASRALVPNGLLGGLLETDRLSVDYQLQLGPRATFTLAVDVHTESTVGTGDFERDRWQIQPGVSWRLAERWRLLANLRYRTRDFERSALITEADSTGVVLSLRYTHPRAQWSR